MKISNRIIKYTLEDHIYAKHGCDICVKIVRGVRVPNINVSGINIENDVLSWVILPIIDSINKYYFLSYEKTRWNIDN